MNTPRIKWQLIGCDLEKDLHTSPRLKSRNEEEALEIVQARQAVLDAEHFKSSWGDRAAKVFWLRSAGTVAYVIPRWIVRKITLGGGSCEYAEAMKDVDLVDHTFNRSVFEIPDAPPDWMKKPPTITLEGEGYDIVQDWWGGRWSNVLYGGSSVP